MLPHWKEVADQTFYLTQSQYTDTEPTSPSADPISPGAWQGSHWSANLSHWCDSTPKKIPAQAGFERGIFRSRGRPHEEHRPSASAPDSVRSFPGMTASQQFCLGVSAPYVPGSSPLSLPLWIPGQSLPGDVVGRLPEGMSLPHVFLGSSPLPLWIPGQSQPGDVAGWLTEGAASPTPLCSTDLCGSRPSFRRLGRREEYQKTGKKQ